MSKPKLTVFSLLCHVYQLFSADPTFELLYHLEYIPLDPSAALAAYILQNLHNFSPVKLFTMLSFSYTSQHQSASKNSEL